ncbi:MAG TPA: hypothetical protein PKN80_04245 [bacterium]|uniref:Translocation protein TolB n=1 Tax=candidate division TA06 bacterium ADurb.Bin417 TaxID=1852828 RepID=A0A1V5MDH2_UNCT6|nr:MAG: translocation protein TolB [candidate division TA06 bacterium ADurb.Bin417]HNQ35256.1 hypothetical protein [bacterium]HNS48281.1 hypothetical protein [bacterium]
MKHKKWCLLVLAFLLLGTLTAQASINHGLLGVFDDDVVESIVQITPGDPLNPTQSAKDWVPCWGVNPWSYDGEWIVYQAAIGTGASEYQRNEICIIRPDGTGWQRLTNNTNTCDNHGNFTPDGNRILFQRYDDSEDYARIWIMDRDGTDQQNLTAVHGGPVNGNECEQKPMVSPDGTKIAFRACVDRDTEEIWVMDIDGTDPIKVSGNINKGNKHSWSPDSQWVLFSADPSENSNSRIYKVRRDGTGLVMLSEEVGDFCENWANWSPDGN